MPGMNVDGLVSGLDTTTIISQLMTLERQPQTRLTAEKTALDKLAELYRQINAKLAATQTASEALNLGTGWRIAKATSSDSTRVTATTATTTNPGALTFRVMSLASPTSVVSDGTVAGTATFSGAFTVNGVQIGDSTTRSLSEIASAITASTAGVNATVVKVGDDAYRLQLSSKTNGENPITVSGLDNGLAGFNTVVSTGSLAMIHVGSPTAGFDVTSATNTISDVLPGTTLTLLAADPNADVTITIANDPSAIADQVQKLVAAVNDTLQLIKSNSGYDETTKKAGQLLTNQITRTLSADLARAVTDPVSGATLMGPDVGISIDRYGVASFDRTKFLAAYDADPAAVERLFTGGVVNDTTDDGLAERLRVFTTRATSLSTGPLNLALETLGRTTKSLDDQIANWDVRLALRETALRRQFTAMETALGQAKSLSSWLSSQIAGLPTYSQ